MDLLIIGKIIGFALCLESVLMLFPLIFALIYGESVLPFVIPVIIAALGGVFLIKLGRRSDRLASKEGYVSTGLSWIVLSLVGMLPFLICKGISSPIDAFFETVSGFTTTGSSILTDVEALPKSVLIWRSFTHWIGGMGILVLMSAILKLGGGSQMNLIKAESPGPVVSKLLPKAGDTARVLYFLYTFLTLATLVALLLAGMPFFDALCITFGAAGTGGFGVLNTSCASYTVVQQIIITIAMLAFGVNFNFYFFILLRRFRQAFHMEEVRTYLLIVLAAVLLIGLNLNFNNGFAAPLLTFQNAAFHVASMITTTGYGTDDINRWPAFSQCVIVMLMFVGACAGSTGGGFKVSRLLLMWKAFLRDLTVHLRPDVVKKVNIDGKTVDENIIRETGVYTFIYIVIIILSVMLISLNGLDWPSTVTSVIATFNNIGPGIGINGTVGNYASFSGFSKIVLSADMLIGRLEIFPILALFSRESWKKF